MSEATYNKIRTIGVLSSNSKTRYEFSLVKWGNQLPKFDIRRWNADGTIPYKGASLSQDEVLKIYEILSCSIDKIKSAHIVKSINLNGLIANIYDILGEYKHTKNMTGKVSFTSWGSTPKYDIRMWNNDYSACGKGITLSDLEAKNLIEFIRNELQINQKDNESVNSISDFDTSDIDDLLIFG